MEGYPRSSAGWGWGWSLWPFGGSWRRPAADPRWVDPGARGWGWGWWRGGAPAVEYAPGSGYRDASGRWVEGEPELEETIDDYWAETRHPLPSLVFILPFLLFYELGVLWLSGWTAGDAGARSGADAWAREWLVRMGVAQGWVTAAALVVGLIGWHFADPLDYRFPRPLVLWGMLLESAIWAVVLIGLCRGVDAAFQSWESGELAAWLPPGVELRLPKGEGFDRFAEPDSVGEAGSTNLDSSSPPVPTSNSGPIPLPDAGLASYPYPARFAELVGFVGAGIYEESLFRLLLIPAAYLFFRVTLAPRWRAWGLAMLASAALFSLAHHAGPNGEPFTWFACVFRFTAGLLFAGLFVFRGFGIAVGAHIAYDVLVGWLGWRF